MLRDNNNIHRLVSRACPGRCRQAVLPIFVRPPDFRVWNRFALKSAMPRAATLDDIPALLAIENRCFQQRTGCPAAVSVTC
jgi:hypothetical protein